MAEMGVFGDVGLARDLGERTDRRNPVLGRGLVGLLALADQNRDPDPVAQAAEEALLRVPVAQSPVHDCRRNADRPGRAQERLGLARAFGRPSFRQARPPMESRRGAMSMPSPPVEAGGQRLVPRHRRAGLGLVRDCRDPLPAARPDHLARPVEHQRPAARADAPSRA
jgi:hypothetical protein